jgi:hypothetical protein
MSKKASNSDIRDLTKSIQELIKQFGITSKTLSTASSKSQTTSPGAFTGPIAPTQGPQTREEDVKRSEYLIELELEKEKIAKENFEREENLQKLLKDRSKLASDLTANEKNFGSAQFKNFNISSQIAENNKLLLEYAKLRTKAVKEDNSKEAERLEKVVESLKANKDLLKSYEQTAKQQDIINKKAEASLKQYKKIGNFLKEPSKMLDKLGDTLNSSIAERFNKSLAAPQKSIMEIASSGIQMGLIGGFIMAAKRAVEINDHIVNMRRQFGLTNHEAHKVHDTLLNINKESKIKGVVQEDVNKAYGELASTFGTIHAANQQLIDGQMLLTKHVGMTAEQATNFQETSFGTGKTVESQLGMIRAQVTEYNQLTGDSIDVHETQKAIASVAKGTAATYGGYGPKLVQAVIQAKRLGVSLEDAEGISKSLLDVETSLESEMKANVLTGKHMNLNRARELALMGEHTKAVEEVVKQAGGYSELMDMAPYQQEAIAAAAGMTKDQLIQTTMQEEKNKTLKDLQIKDLKSMTAAQRNSLITSKKFTEEQLKQMETAEQEATTKEKMAQMQSKLLSLFDQMAGPLTKVVELISAGMSKLIDGITGATKGLKAMMPDWLKGFAKTETGGKLGTAVAAVGGIALAYKGIKKMMAKSPEEQQIDLLASIDSKVGGGAGGGNGGAGADGGGGPESMISDIAGGGKKKGIMSRVGKFLGKSKIGKFLGKAGGLLGAGMSMFGLGGDDEEEAPSAPSGGSGSTPGAASTGTEDAAKEVAESSKSGTSQLTSSPAPSAPKKAGGLFGKIGGFFSKVVDKAKNLAGKLNPLNAIKGAFKGPGLKKILGKIPKIGGIVNAAMSLGSAATSGGGDPQEVGKQIVMAIGDMGGTFLGGLLGSLVPGAGTVLGGFLGGYGGSALAGLIADNVDLSGIGKAAISMFGGDAAKEGTATAPGAASSAPSSTSTASSTSPAASTSSAGSSTPSAVTASAPKPTATVTATTPTAGSTNTKTMTATSTPTATPTPAAGGTSGGSGIESLLKELIAKVDQPLKLTIGSKVINEISNQTSLKRNMESKMDRGYGTV